MKAQWIILVLAGLISGCAELFTHTVYHQPLSAEGRVCTSQCFNAQKQCENLMDKQYQECDKQHGYAMDAYKRCKEAGGKSCKEPPRCNYPSHYQCESDYKACFSACGGTMEEAPGL